jgi:hypothetical protein
MTAWRYFLCSAEGSADAIYRCPANGKKIEDQTITDVYLLLSDGSWRPGGKWKLINEMCRGWFSEEDDEISEEKAQELCRTWQAGTWPGRS